MANRGEHRAGKGAAKTRALYDVHPSVAMVQKCIAELKEETGRSLEEWMALIVPLYRTHVFAQLKPTTNTRIDLGFALTRYKGKLPKRLIDTGGLAKKDRITHRIEITAAEQIDGEVKKWLKTAYDLDT